MGEGGTVEREGVVFVSRRECSRRRWSSASGEKQPRDSFVFSMNSFTVKKNFFLTSKITSTNVLPLEKVGIVGPKIS